MSEAAEEPVRKQVLDKMATLLTSAFALVAALAWNDAIKQLFAKLLPSQDGQIVGLFVYAAVVTVVAVLATLWIGRLAQKIEDLEKAISQRD